MTMRHLKTIMYLCSMALFSAAVFLVVQTQEVKFQPLTWALAARAQPAAAVFTSGEERSYAVHVHSDVTAAGTQSAAPGPTATLDAKGTLRLITLTGEHEVLVRLTDCDLNFGRGPAGSDAAAIKVGLSTGMNVSYAPDGAILSFHGAPDLNRVAAGLLRQLTSGMQLSLVNGRSEWTAQEMDANGAYEASYSVVADAHDNKGATLISLVDKEIAGYSAMAPTAAVAGQQLSGHVKGHFATRLDRVSGWPRDTSGQASVTIYGHDGLVVSHSVTSFNYQYSGAHQLPPETVARLAGTANRRGLSPQAVAPPPRPAH